MQKKSLVKSCLSVVCTLGFPVCLLVIMVSHSWARDYESPWHSARWQFQKARLECRLQHKIPYYGKATFINHAIYGMQFRVTTRRPVVKNSKANIISQPPEWKPNLASHTLGQVKWNRGRVPLYLQRDWAVTLISELEKGQEPTLKFVDRPGPNDQVKVRISVIHFKPEYDKFIACSRKLGQFSYKRVRRAVVRFDSARHHIKPGFSRRLDEMAAYIARNDSIKLVSIDGHTDIVGGHSYNIGLSKRRALAVKRYLVERKVPAKMIRIHYYGKMKPVRSNNSAEGRRQNRRARIQLIRD